MAKKWWYVTIERTIEVIERAEEVEVEAETEEEAHRLALAKANVRGRNGLGQMWDECEKRVTAEEVVRAISVS